MTYKISFVIIITQTVLILGGLFFFFNTILPDIKNHSNEKSISLENGKDWKACMVNVIDKEVNREIARNRYVISKDNVCPKNPQNFYLSKSEFINQLNSNKGWGIFDDNYTYPDLIKPDISKQSSSTISVSSK